MNTTAYQKVTDALIQMLQEGQVPWQKPWTGMVPMNAESNRPYKGINTVILGLSPFKDVRWITFKGVQRLEGRLKAGSKSRPVVLYQVIEKKDKNTGDVISRFPMLRYFNVFNVEQCEGLKLKPLEEIIPVTNHDPIAAAETIVANMPKRPRIEHGYQAAWYQPSNDLVGMPNREQFAKVEGYYSTLFHELGHSTGHPTRLNREGLMKITRFGSEDYSEEELTAEFLAAFLCDHAGIDSTRENSAAYLASWIKVLKNDIKLAVKAAGRAAKAADFILGKSQDDTIEEEVESGELVAA